MAQTNIEKIDLIDFYKTFLFFTDKVLPSVPPVEQPILLYIFSHSIGMGRNICQLSYTDFHDLAGHSYPTIKSVLKSLNKKGYIRTVDQASAKIPKKYEIIRWPEDKLKKTRVQRDADSLIRDMFFADDKESIIDKFNAEDRDLLSVTIANLSKDEESYFRSLSQSLAKEHMDPEKVFKEIVAQKKFGKARIMKYETIDEDDEPLNE